MSSSSASSGSRRRAAPPRRARAPARRACDRAGCGGAAGRWPGAWPLHQPGARVARDARRRPLLEGRDQRVVRQVLGRAEVAHQAHQAGDQLRRLEAPHRLDGGVGVGCHAVGPDPAAGAKSSASKTAGSRRSRRSYGYGFGQRRIHSITSAFDRHCRIQKPAISSLVSANGPSTTVRSLPLKRDASALRAGLQPVAGQHHAGLDQLLVERPHLRQLFRGRHHARFRFLRGLDDHHETHLNLLRGSRRSARCGPAVLSTRRTGRAGIDTDPESTNQEHVVTFMLIRKADRETEAYNGESGQ